MYVGCRHWGVPVLANAMLESNQQQESSDPDHAKRKQLRVHQSLTSSANAEWTLRDRQGTLLQRPKELGNQRTITGIHAWLWASPAFCSATKLCNGYSEKIELNNVNSQSICILPIFLTACSNLLGNFVLSLPLEKILADTKALR